MFPVDVLRVVLAECDHRTISSFRCTYRGARHVVNEQFWRFAVERRFGTLPSDVMGLVVEQEEEKVDVVKQEKEVRGWFSRFFFAVAERVTELTASRKPLKRCLYERCFVSAEKHGAVCFLAPYMLNVVEDPLFDLTAMSAGVLDHFPGCMAMVLVFDRKLSKIEEDLKKIDLGNNYFTKVGPFVTATDVMHRLKDAQGYHCSYSQQSSGNLQDCEGVMRALAGGKDVHLCQWMMGHGKGFCFDQYSVRDELIVCVREGGRVVSMIMASDND